MPQRKKKAHPAPAPTEDRPVARALWSGSITFGLVTVPVELYTASKGRGVSLRMLGPDNGPLAREYVCPKDGEALESSDLSRGYPVGDDRWVLVSDEELAELAPRRSRDIELTRFVPREAIDPAWFDRPYFLVPGAEQSKAYRLLAETMEQSGRAALAHFVMRGKAYPVAIFAERGLLRAETLRHGDELRTVHDVALPEPVDADPKRVARMRRAIERLAADSIDETELLDDSARQVRERAETKRKRGQDVVEISEESATAEDPEDEGEVVDLVALIRKRLGGAPTRRKAPVGEKAPSKKAAKPRAGVKRSRRAAARRP